MAAAYFDATDAYDKLLLHSSVRTDSEADRVAEQVETEIIDFYTEQGILRFAQQDSNDGTYWYKENDQWFTILLWGYKPAAADANGYDATRSDWTGFCKAFRRTVAEVTSHRLRHYHAERGVTSETAGRESWTYSTARDTDWPPNWRKYLRRYDKKPPVWSL